MVMSQDLCDPAAGGKASPALPRDRDTCRERVSDREKELAAEASGAFTKGDYTGCLNSLEKLEVRALWQSWMLRMTCNWFMRDFWQSWIFWMTCNWCTRDLWQSWILGMMCKQ